MIIVFVIDTSPSMGLPVSGGDAGSGMSRLDVAKMAVEEFVRQWRKRQSQHVRLLQEIPAAQQRSLLNVGLGGSGGSSPSPGTGTATANTPNTAAASGGAAAGVGGGSTTGSGGTLPDSLLLLSTAVPQHAGDADITSACAAGGRLLVSFAGSSASATFDGKQQQQQQQQNAPADSASLDTTVGQQQQQEMMEAFQKELKGLQCYNKWEPGQGRPFPDDAGGASGLNAALSAGLQLLSRYRLHNRWTENFGMGRFTSTASMTPTAAGNPAMAALQPACLVVLTDGACLRQSPKVGGGSLQLQYGSQPLREMYNEPFRWDQRIFCLGIGGGGGGKSGDSPSVTSSQFLHPQLRALCEVTGGSHWLINKAAGNQLSSVAESILKRLCPPLVRELPVPDPLYLRMNNNNASSAEVFPTANTTAVRMNPGLACYIHGGPAVNLQCIEQDDLGGSSSSPKTLRAMLLYTASSSTTVSVETASVLSPPLWCIPEAYFPGKKLDTLPPRKAQPLLLFSKYPSNLGSKSFEPLQVIKMLHRLDQLTIANRKVTLGLMQPQQPQPKCLHRDTYICEWLSPEGGKPVQVSIATQSRQEYFPVLVPGAGRSTLSDEGDNFLNIGILHVPVNGSSTLAASANASRLATLTLLPPEPHILLPLLVRAAEAEHRVLKKLEAKGNKSVPAKISVPLDEHWRAEFRAYMFRVPPYYQYALRRALRPVLPAGTANALPMDSPETILYQCFSKVCLQKIRQGEQVARDNSERLERQEMSLRRRGGLLEGRSSEENKTPNLRYGQFDARASVDSYLAALRNMPAPWRVRAGGCTPSSTSTPSAQHAQKKEESGQEADSETAPMPRSCLDVLGDLPASCLMAYYESRRRWLFGGTGLSTRGLHVAGVNNDGSNSQRCDTKPSEQDECLLSLAGVGVSMINQTSTTKMGDYRERLLFSRAPIVGTGSNDYAGVSTTTAIDGSPKWSVDDDALPATFFNPLTGEFTDNVQARVRSRLMVNFGNPYKEKRADSIVPEKFLSQSPSAQRGQLDSEEDSLGPRTPPGSPPHESWDSVEEGEAIFVRKSPTRTSPKREDPPDDLSSSSLAPPTKKNRSNSMDKGSDSPKSIAAKDKPPPPKPPSAPRLQKPPPPKPSLGGPPKPPPKPSGSAPPPPKPPPKQPPTSSSGAAAVAPPPKPPAPPGKAVKRPSSVVAPPLPPLSRHTSGGGGGGGVRPPAPPKPPPKPPAGGATGPPGGARPPAPDIKKRRSSSISVPPPPPPSAAASATTSSSSSSSTAPAPAPAAAAVAVAAPTANTSTTTTPTPQDLQRPDAKPQVDLPPGWMCVWSKSQKRWYFFNQRNNKSVWQWPPPK